MLFSVSRYFEANFKMACLRHFWLKRRSPEKKTAVLLD